MRSSYSEKDVVLLLKDITGLVKPQPTKEREKLIQSGKHYSSYRQIYGDIRRGAQDLFKAGCAGSRPVIR